MRINCLMKIWVEGGRFVSNFFKYAGYRLHPGKSYLVAEAVI
jgi:hypothetical protein